MFGFGKKKREPEAPNPVAQTKKGAEELRLREELNMIDTTPSITESIVPYVPPAGVAPSSHVKACDAAIDFNAINGQFTGNAFPGYYKLSNLATISEYRDMSGRLADEMTRKWIKVRSTSEDDRSDVIKKIEAALDDFDVRGAFRRAAELDGLMGRSQIFIDLGVSDTLELKTPLLADKAKVGKGSLKGIRVVEPHNTYPGRYDAENALREDYYTPQTWYVNATEVHSSRLLTFIGRELPVLLRPAYNFSGVSISQLAEDCVNNWFKTRNSVSRLVSNFSTSILKTNMSSVLRGGKFSEIVKRATVFTKMRDNQGLFLLDNQQEDFQQVNTPLSGLNLLQAQAQEHMAAVAKIPLVVLLGISPTGLNASSEGEIRVFYDYVGDMQEKLYRRNLTFLLKVVQLHLFGTIHDDITFDFVPLYALTAEQEASIRTQDANNDKVYVETGIIAADEARKRIARNPTSGYDNLDLNRKIEKPNPLGLGGDPNNPTAPGSKKSEPGDPKKPLPQGHGKPGDTGEDASPFITGMSGASFYGNQHTGRLEEDFDTEYGIACKHSAVAYRAHTAAIQGTFDRRNHERAILALERALHAWAYLEQTDDQVSKTVCEAYRERIKAMIEQHQGILAARSAE